MTSTHPPSASDLPGLVAPHFVPGQLLTCADLETLVAYTQARLGLAGTRDGYGVVRGLGVRLDSRRDRQHVVYVEPGYAVGPRGEDIVVHSPFEVQVTAPFTDDPSRASAVDLFIEPRQERTDPVPGFAIDDAFNSSGTYSRVVDGLTLTAEPVRSASSPVSLEVSKFMARFAAARAPWEEFHPRRHDDRPPDQVAALRSRLLATEFRFMADYLNTDDQSEISRAWPLAVLLLVQHLRNAIVAGYQSSETRVLIGRLWVDSAGQGAGARIVAVDERGAHRRRIADPVLPAPPGHVNAGIVLWETEEVARLRLADMGVSVSGVHQVVHPENWDQLSAALTTRLFLRPSHKTRLFVLEQEYFGRRVIGVADELDRHLKILVDCGVLWDPSELGDIVSAIVVEESPDEVTEIEVERVEPVLVLPTEESSDGVVEIDVEPVLVLPTGFVGALIVYRKRDQMRVEVNRIDLIEGGEVVLGDDGAEIRGDKHQGLLDRLEHRATVIVEDGEVRLHPNPVRGVKVNGATVHRQGALTAQDVVEVDEFEFRISLVRP
jgi:hypothetical protein